MHTESEVPRAHGAPPTPCSPWSSALPPCENAVNHAAPAMGFHARSLGCAGLPWIRISQVMTRFMKCSTKEVVSWSFIPGVEERDPGATIPFTVETLDWHQTTIGSPAASPSSCRLQSGHPRYLADANSESRGLCAFTHHDTARPRVGQHLPHLVRLYEPTGGREPPGSFIPARDLLHPTLGIASVNPVTACNLPSFASTAKSVPPKNNGACSVPPALQLNRTRSWCASIPLDSRKR